MIQQLRVENLALIESLEIELCGGLHVVTGETGAGKSVLLSAVALLSGRRVSSEAVRTGAPEARVEAVCDGPLLLERARELGLADESDESLLVTRTISQKGRGKVLVNGRLATVELLARLMDGVIEVASQGDHQRLLRPELQTELVDAHGDLAVARRLVADRYEAWRAFATELQDRTENAAERARRVDQLTFELEQIDRASLAQGELARIDQEHARLAHVEQLDADTAFVLEHLDGDGGSRTRLRAARGRLRTGKQIDPALADVDAAIERAELECADAVLALERYRAELDPDPRRLAQVEERLAEIRRLQLRYGDSIEAILAYRDEAREELARLCGGGDRTRTLEAELRKAETALDEAAKALTGLRATAADDLAHRVAEELGWLDMGKARFEVRLEPISLPAQGELRPPCGPGGYERLSFWLAANPGEDPRRLRDAASGGELARLMLALRNALRGDHPRVLLFDEADAGVGGRTAVRVGERLRALAQTHTVLCITHLPQVAAMGHTHDHVRKLTEGGRTRTVVERIDGDARVDEIARMASGGRITETARAHARELLSS
jgi:DNA repair protein RecN (Recombination protein N)